MSDPVEKLAPVGNPIRRWAEVVLTPQEWLVLFKLVTIAALLFVLVYVKIAIEFPAEQFIYGRF